MTAGESNRQRPEEMEEKRPGLRRLKALRDFKLSQGNDLLAGACHHTSPTVMCYILIVLS